MRLSHPHMVTILLVNFNQSTHNFFMYSRVYLVEVLIWLTHFYIFGFFFRFMKFFLKVTKKFFSLIFLLYALKQHKCRRFLLLLFAKKGTSIYLLIYLFFFLHFFFKSSCVCHVRFTSSPFSFKFFFNSVVSFYRLIISSIENPSGFLFMILPV